MIALFALIVLANAKVVSLNNKNFFDIVGKDEHVFVKFFAPWCGHCKRLAPEYEKLSDALASNKQVVIAEIDCDNSDNKDVCGKYGVSGYPTLKFFRRGSTEPDDYNGARSLDDLKKFVEEAMKPKIPSNVVVLTDDNFDKIVEDKTKNVFVKFYAPWCGHCKALAPKYIDISKMYAGEEDLIVAEVDCTVNTKTWGKFNVGGYPTLKSFPKDNKKGVEYEGGRDIKDFVAYFNKNYGYERDETGKLEKTVGRIAELDEIAKGFAGKENKEELIAKAEKVEGGKYYVKTMKRIVEKGEGYIAKEKARIQKMIDAGNLKAKKVDDFQRNLNILAAFDEE